MPPTKREAYEVEITDAEVLAVTGGINEATGQPIIVVTLRPDANRTFASINVALRPENAVIFAEQLQIALREKDVKGKFKMPQSIASMEDNDDYHEEL